MVAKIFKPISWLAILGLVMVTVVPADDRPVTGLRHAVEHFLAFGFTGLTFGLAYARRLSPVLPSAILFSLALELSQIPLPTRHARLEDFVVDSVAACCGIIIAYGFRKVTENQAVAVR